MNRAEIDWRSGHVAYWGLDELDESGPLSAQLSQLREDLAQVSYPNRVLIDVGWYPSFSAAGEFTVVVVVGEDWERPLSQDRCASVAALRACLQRAVNVAIKAGSVPRD